MRFIEFTRRIGLVMFAIFAFAACTDELATGQAGQDVLTPNLTAYTSGQDIVVNYTGMSGATTDWISIAYTTDPADTYEVWQYTGGGATGTVTFTAPALTGGSYQARGYYDWAGTSSFTIQQTSASFTISGGATPTVSTDKLGYASGENVTVSWTNLPGNQLDWIAISAAGSPAASYVTYVYTMGATSGTHVFTGLPSGNYEARAYLDNKYAILAKSTFSIAGSTTITTDALTYTAGTTVNVQWANTPGNMNDYVAVSVAGSPATSTVAQVSTNGATSGTAPFSGLAAGNYEARAYLNGTSTILAPSTFSVTAVVLPSVTTDASNYALNQPITVTFANMPANPTDYVSIATVGSPDTTFVAYLYTGGTASGSLQFNGIPAGTYEARAYPSNSYTVIARSSQFTVGGVACVVPTTVPVLGSIASGDLTISATEQSHSAPLTVAFASTILFTSVSEDEKSPNFGAVICTLHDVDPDLGAAGVTCRRNDVGTDTSGSSGQITIHWTAVTFTSGVTVQRGEANTNGTNPLAVTLTTIDPTNSFVLLGGQVNGGSGWGSNEFVRAEILDATTLDLHTFVSGTTLAWQVVSMVGATVQRGGVTLAAGATAQSATIATAPTGSFVMASYTTDNASGVPASQMMLATTLTNPTTIGFSRSASGTNLDVSWEVVSLPFATNFGVAAFGAGQTAQSIPLAGIASTSSVAIGSSQSIFGQTFGSTTYAGADGDLVGEASATMTTGSGTLSIVRSASTASSSIPWTVIDFAHNCAGQ
ncbi:hypothetical protein BH11MYX1_BH11MYX1_20610 [soil metagenome]